MSAPVVAVLHHLGRPFSGHADAVLSGAGVMLDERDVRRDDPLPELSEVDGILSLGGEQSVLDIGREPGLAAEAALLRAAVELRRGPGHGAEAFRVGPSACGVQFHAEVDEQARAADARHLAGQRALSEALFGGFARVVDALRRDDRARFASPGGR